MSFAKISHDLIVITPCEFIEISEANYHLMWKSCLQVRENDTKKVKVKVKRIVNVDVVYFVHHVKVFGECQRYNISCIAFSGQII